MAFYDYDLTEQVKGKHELSEIEEVVGFSGLVYRFKDLANSVGRQGYGVEVGIGFVDLRHLEKPPIIAFLDDSERPWEQNG